MTPELRSWDPGTRDSSSTRHGFSCNSRTLDPGHGPSQGARHQGHRATRPPKGPLFRRSQTPFSQVVTLNSLTGRNYSQQLQQISCNVSLMQRPRKPTHQQQVRDVDRKYEWPRNLKRCSILLIMKQKCKFKQKTISSSQMDSFVLN